MTRDKSILGTATKDTIGKAIGEPNVFTVDVPTGEIWYVEDITVDGDASRVYGSIFTDVDNTAKILDMQGRANMNGRPYDSEITSDGLTLFATRAEDGKFTIIDTYDMSIITNIGITGGNNYGLALENDENTIWATGVGAVNEVDVSTVTNPSSINSYTIGTGTHRECVLNSDDSELFVTSENNVVYRVDTSTGNILDTYNFASVRTENPQLTSDDSTLYFESYDSIYKVDIGTGNLLTTITPESGSDIRHIKLSNDETRLYVGMDTGKIYKIDSSDGSNIDSYQFYSNEIAAIDIISDDSKIVVGDTGNRVLYIDTTTGELEHENSVTNNVTSITIASDDNSIYVGDKNSRVWPFILTSILNVQRLVESATPLNKYAYGGDTIALAVDRPLENTPVRVGIRQISSPPE